eukprot:TRINITY_DN5376_c1_g1_i1.p1 TRINITY_DN5376_c1_g1~~TRINITY_DN5376_c1_g1_i1.p1  ORF type:complete len:1006 (-),score=395.93 TRINITY_DN5376_c1_g1_i1:166-2994(-)
MGRRSKKDRHSRRKSWDPKDSADKRELLLDKSMLFMGTKETPKEEKQRRRRVLIKNEIVSTERSYATGLSKVVEVYLQPIIEREYDLQLSGLEPQITEEDRNAVFGNIEDIASISNRVVKRLEERIETAHETVELETSFVDVFMELVRDKSFFEGYSKYINKVSDSCARLNDMLTQYKEDPENASPLAKFIAETDKKEEEKLLSDPSANCESLASIMITPIQRVPRYVLLLNQLLEFTPRGSRDASSLTNLLAEMEAMAARLNERKRYAESTRQFLEGLNIDLAREYLIADGPMMSPGMDDPSKFDFVHLFLFHNQILCAKRTRDHTLVLLWQVQLVNASFVERDNLFEIQEMRNITKYPFVFCTTFVLRPQKTSEVCTWRSNFNLVFGSFWQERDQKQMFASKIMLDHIADKLFREEDWRVLCVGAKEMEYEENESILRRGETHASLSYILEGSVRIEVEVQDEDDTVRKVTISTLQQGQSFGEMTLLSGKEFSTSSAAVVADTPCKILAMSKRALDRVLISQPRLAIRFYEHLCYMLANRFLRQPLKQALSSGGPKLERVPSKLQAAPIEGKGQLFDGVGTTDETQEAQQQQKNAKYLSKLKLEDETVISTYPCEYNKIPGVLIVMQQHVGFYGKMFGKTVRQAMDKNSVYQVRLFTEEVHEKEKEKEKKKKKAATRRRPAVVVIMLEGMEAREFYFDESGERDEAFALLSNLLGKTTKVLPGKAGPSPLMLKTSSWTSAEFRNMAREKTGSCAMTEDDWLFLSQHADVTKYKRGEVVLAAGDRPLALFQVTRGSCRVEMPSSDPLARPRSVGKLEQGEVFGEISFVLGLRSTATIVAEEKTTITRFPRQRLDEIFKCGAETGGTAHEDIGAAFYHFLARNLRDLFAKSESKVAVKYAVPQVDEDACAGCGTSIRGNGVKLSGRNYHQDCMDEAVRRFRV